MMKRSILILIGSIVALSTLIGTSVMIHRKRTADKILDSTPEETLLAPPEGFDESQILDFYENNATATEYVRFEDGKEVVEDKYGRCSSYKYGPTTYRYNCYSAVATYCKYPCRVNVFPTGVTRDFSILYTCSCI
jgi:hypothetical protein